jgi:hypothetical protein
MDPLLEELFVRAFRFALGHSDVVKSEFVVMGFVDVES